MSIKSGVKVFRQNYLQKKKTLITFETWYIYTLYQKTFADKSSFYHDVVEIFYSPKTKKNNFVIFGTPFWLKLFLFVWIHLIPLSGPFYSPGPQGGCLGRSRPILPCVLLCPKTVKIPALKEGLYVEEFS